MPSKPVFRIRRDLIEDPQRLTGLAKAAASALAAGKQSTPTGADATPPNGCDEDPNCVYLGMFTFEGVSFKAYDCEGDIALYEVT